MDTKYTGPKECRKWMGLDEIGQDENKMSSRKWTQVYGCVRVVIYVQKWLEMDMRGLQWTREKMDYTRWDQFRTARILYLSRKL